MSKKHDHTWTEKPATKIAVAILKAQAKFSGIMNKQLNKLSLSKLKISLIAFCMIWGGLSIYFIFFNKQSKIKVERIKTVRPMEDDPEGRIDNQTIDNIHLYKEYMDSIKQPISPGLLDSMNYLEEMYLQQQK